MATNSANVDEFGTKLRINVNEDISAATVSMEFNPPNTINFIVDASNGVTVPAGDVVIDADTTYSGNEYAEYPFEDGVLDIQGTWKVRLISETAGKRVKTDFLDFSVLP